MLATGSRPAVLPVEGADHPGVIYVRDRASGERLRGLRGADIRAVVIGSGFIGCEAAASLARTGTMVTMLTPEAVPHERRLGPDAGHRVAEWLRSDGVDLQTDAKVSRIERDGDGWQVTLADGRALGCDAVVSASGATPDASLAREAGLSIRDDAIAVDASMRSSDQQIWAAGDVASAVNRAAGRPLRVEHWGEAETMGEIAGRAIAGQGAAWDQPPGFWSEIGDRTLKYSAWGDGFDHAELLENAAGWAVVYAGDGLIVGVLCHEWDDVYEHAQQLISDRRPFAEAKVALGAATGQVAPPKPS
ncbi:NAD(P)/FAD-dependent oxidoreductase [Microlunatus endophyticus]